MSDKKKCLMVGVGGMANVWLRDFWTPFRDRVEFSALADVNRQTLDEMGEFLGVTPAARFTSTREAFEKADADFCCIVTPPAFHQEAVEAACARKLDILSEKPIADTWKACCAIYKAVEQSGVKMLVTQNYRYNTNILTLKKAIGELGAVNYVASRYASDYRARNSWGKFRHEIPHTLLVEGGIHHLDQIRNLTGANCQTISGYEWHPGHVRGDDAKWKGSDSFDGEPCGLFVLRMTNGSLAQYEGNNLATGKTNSWHHEYYRAECEGGAAVLDNDNVVRVEERGENGAVTVREVPNEKPQWEGHKAMPAQFLEWLDGGATPPTVLADNIQSNATMFAAIEASTHNTVVDVQQMVEQATS
jgi:predicted dehydrogenase